MSDEAVVGWVHGVPVPSAAVGQYLRELAKGSVGARLGITGEPDVRADLGLSRAAGLRAWGVKALLADTLLRAEAARLKVADLKSPEDWLARLEAAGELDDQMPTEADMRARYYLANIHRFRLSESRRVRHVLVEDSASAQHLLKVASDIAALAQLATDSSLDKGSRSRGGDLGWVERGHLAGPLEEAIFAESSTGSSDRSRAPSVGTSSRWRRSDTVGPVPFANAAGRSRSNWPSTVGIAPGWPGSMGE